MTKNSYQLEPIGTIRSKLTELDEAPMQGYEGGHEAWLEVSPQVADGLVGIKPGDHLVVLTWLHLAQRDTLKVHPRGRQEAPIKGVFATRSQDRPNPIGLHQVRVLEVAKQKIKVAPMEAIDGTPIVDIKPVLSRKNGK
ncbi:MAG: tRNA (N6-threonylcarbamoyladenosine(37)-N6)-methyltransferase TrmO [Anaerolineales bacterium]